MGYSGDSERWRRLNWAWKAAAAERSTSELLILLFLRERGGRVREVEEGATRRNVCSALLDRTASLLVLGRSMLGRKASGIGSPRISSGMHGNCSKAWPSSIVWCSLGWDFAARSLARLRTLRSVSMGRRDMDLRPADSESESDSQTDCSQKASIVEIEGRSMEVAVHWREIGGELATGLGTGLGQSLAGMKRGWSK